MKEILIITAIFIITSLVTILTFYFIKRTSVDKRILDAEERVKQTLNESNKQVSAILTKAEEEAKELLLQSRYRIEEEVKNKTEVLRQTENRLMQKEQHLDTRETHLVEREDTLAKEIEKIKTLKKKQDTLVQELLTVLEKAAGFSREEAKTVLLKNVEREMRQKSGIIIKEIEQQAQKIGNRKAKEIITTAIQRTALEHIPSLTTSIVNLPDDEMKGRIIGREGRNIRTFEASTGTDIIIDDTPNAVVVSSFDPIRREVAKLSLEKLVQDGRIHPSRIEEIVEKSKIELNDLIKEIGEQTIDELRLNINPKLAELLGKLSFRTSYGQNVLAHSLEVSHLASIMAAELGVNENLAKRAGLLHDIGKAVDFEQEGSHTKLGVEIAKKYGESEEVLNCIAAHHEDVPCETIESVLVMIADAISAARPGARKESMENYLKRLHKLEEIAQSFEGIEKSYAIQAGREIRVLVNPDVIDDSTSHKLAFDIAKKIEQEMDYPGEIKVSLIRETRATGIAK